MPHPNISVSLADDMVRRMEGLKLSQTQLAKKLGCSPRTLRRWLQGEKPSEGSLISIKRELDYTDLVLKQLTGVAKPSKYSPVWFSELSLQSGGLAEAEKAMDLFEEQEPVPPENRYGNIDNWLTVFQASLSTACIIRDDENMIAGYWSFLFVNDAFYDKALSGENVNKTISLEALDPLDHQSPLSIYFVDIFTRKDLRHSKQLNEVMLSSIQDTIEYFCINDRFIHRVVANLSGPEIITLALRRGFRDPKDHQEHTMFDPKGQPKSTLVSELKDLSRDEVTLFYKRPWLQRRYKEFNRLLKNSAST